MEQIPRNDDISSVIRSEKTLLPIEIIRELVANAIIHQDLSQTGFAPRVEIFSNRIEISNAGEPLIEPQRFIDTNKSRNDRLAYYMRKYGLCEEKGSGIDRVVKIAELMQLPPPSFETRPGQTVVKIGGYKSFSDLNTVERMMACYQHCCLKYVLSEHMTNETLRKRFGVDGSKSSSVSHVIRACIEADLVKPDELSGGAKRSARYKPIWA